MSLLSSISKPSFPPNWFVVTQAEVEPHQLIKMAEKEKASTSICYVMLCILCLKSMHYNSL